jgi:hypothetical protein
LNSSTAISAAIMNIGMKRASLLALHHIVPSNYNPYIALNLASSLP